MKILHILYQSLPQISGSSIRTRDILMTQKEIGLDVLAITAPFQLASNDSDIINGIKYYRSKINNKESISDRRKPFFSRLLRVFYIFSFSNKLKRLIKVEKPDVLHAHAMFFCGLPALFFGKIYNIPVVYELRSLWMLKKEKKERSFFSKVIESILFKLECFVMRNANCVIVINNNLKQLVVEGGIDESKIKVVKNAINTTLIDQLKERDDKCFKDDIICFGYIGTLTPYEGIDLLIEGFNKFNLNNLSSKLIIYGSGIEQERIESLAIKSRNVYYKGSISPKEIYKAFSEIDIIVNPRYKNILTDSVTPLKPLEAMAYNKIFIGSDVGGIKELINDEVNGFLFKAGDIKSLLEIMNKVSMLSQQEIEQIQSFALKYVTNQKSWLNNATLYEKIYCDLTIIN